MRPDPFGGAGFDLLMLSFPQIRLTRGEKRAALQRAWIAAANGYAMNLLNIDDAVLPRDPHAAALLLLKHVVHLAADQGMGVVDVLNFVGGLADASQFKGCSDPDQNLAAAHAALAVLAARRLQARDPIPHHEGETA